MRAFECEILKILDDYDNAHPQTKKIRAYQRRIELLLRIVAFEASKGLDTGLDFND